MWSALGVGSAGVVWVAVDDFEWLWVSGGIPLRMLLVEIGEEVVERPAVLQAPETVMDRSELLELGEDAGVDVAVGVDGELAIPTGAAQFFVGVTGRCEINDSTTEASRSVVSDRLDAQLAHLLDRRDGFLLVTVRHLDDANTHLEAHLHGVLDGVSRLLVTAVTRGHGIVLTRLGAVVGEGKCNVVVGEELPELLADPRPVRVDLRLDA